MSRLVPEQPLKGGQGPIPAVAVLPSPSEMRAGTWGGAVSITVPSGGRQPIQLGVRGEGRTVCTQQVARALWRPAPPIRLRNTKPSCSPARGTAPRKEGRGGNPDLSPQPFSLGCSPGGQCLGQPWGHRGGGRRREIGQGRRGDSQRASPPSLCQHCWTSRTKAESSFGF